MESAGFTLVGKSLAGELVCPLPSGREPGPVKTFGHQQAWLGVRCYFCIQAALAPAIVYSHQVALADVPLPGVLRLMSTLARPAIFLISEISLKAEFKNR